MADSINTVARWAAILFLPAWAGVVGGELGPASGSPHFWDKALHFAAYLILSVLAVTALTPCKKALWGMAGLVVMGAVLEVIQGLVGRDMSALDELANTLGVLAGGFIGWLVCLALVGRKAAH